MIWISVPAAVSPFAAGMGKVISSPTARWAARKRDSRSLVRLASMQVGGLSWRWRLAMRSRQIDLADGDGGETAFILAGIIEQLALGCLDYKKESLGRSIKNRGGLNRQSAVCPFPSV